MAELDFTVPPQVDVDGIVLDVTVAEANPVFTDAGDYVHISLAPAREKGARTRALSVAEDPRVRRTEADVLGAVMQLALSGATIVKRQRARARQLRGGL